MSIQFPLEVIQLIILYIPFPKLRTLCEEDVSLKLIIAPLLYKYVSIGDFNYVRDGDCTISKFHNITIRELKQLISGSIDVQIQHLKITEVSANYVYFMKVWEIVEDSSEFFLKIPMIDYEGSQFDMCMEFLPVQNLRSISAHSYDNAINFLLDAFPPNITALTIETKKIINMPPLPKSLKHLRLSCYGRKNLAFKFPPYLELFSSMDILFTDKLPEGLLKLETDDVYDITLPDGLIELAVREADALVSFPPGLKKLKLESIDSLVGMKFPCNLEVLDLESVGLTTLDGIVFPSLLRELRLHGNDLESLDNVIFPDLKLLDISIFSFSKEYGIKSLSHVQFPKLEHLIAYGQPVKDWSITSFPDTLKELEMDVIEDPRTLKFPPFLRMLKINFTDDLAEYSELKLPNTLEELSLEGGVSSTFDWNLPQLRYMSITEFSGPITVPEPVVHLCLLYKEHVRPGPIRLLPNVQKLEISYPLNMYPTTVTNLGIDHSDFRSFPLPPNIESFHVDSGVLDGRSFKMPNSLNYFYGELDEPLNMPSNWDSDNEFYEESYLYEDGPMTCILARG